jgi:hypothetical protein
MTRAEQVAAEKYVRSLQLADLTQVALGHHGIPPWITDQIEAGHVALTGYRPVRGTTAAVLRVTREGERSRSADVCVWLDNGRLVAGWAPVRAE